MTARQPSPSARFSAFLSRFPPEIVALVKQCLPRLRRALSGTSQLVYEYRDSLVVSFSPSEHGYEGVVSLSIQPRCVRLYFPKDLPDPKRRLQGAGSEVRSVVVEAAADLNHGDVHELIEAAVERAGVRSSGVRSTRMIIKSVTKPKRRPAAPRKRKG